MAGIIHMETDVVQAVAVKLDQTVLDIYLEISAIGNSLRSLDWQGGDRDEFINNYLSLEKQITAEANRGAGLSVRVKREIEEWLTADNSFLRQESGNAFIKEYPTTPAISDEEKKSYKWYKIPKAILKFVTLIIKNKKISGKIPFVGLIYGTGEDIYEGDTLPHAALSESIETLINLSPVGLWGFVLAIGQIVSAGAETIGYHDTAVNIQDIVGKADISDHLGDAIADFYIHHPAFALTGSNPINMVLSPEVQEFAFGFWAQELRAWGLHDQANWIQNTGNIVVEQMKKWQPRNIFNNYFGIK